LARKERPIDPSEGPLQAFAHDLRGVREQAGNPTYRALATIAGFSASTLSDAAGGMRQPSLEVTLAYVGACGGDAELWQRRWEELNRVLTEQRGGGKASDEAAGTGATEAELAEADGTDQGSGAGARATDARATGDAQPAEDLSPARRTGAEPAPDADTLSATVEYRPDGDSDVVISRGSEVQLRVRWSRRSVTVTVTMVVAACAALGFWLPAKLSTTSRTTASNCGVASSNTPGGEPVRFTGSTKSAGSHIRAGASLNSAMLRAVPLGCSLDFTGYCLGDVIYDSYGGAPDMRWFKVAGGGVISSSLIHGNPPDALAPSSCPDDVPAPTSIALALTPPNADGTVQLHATGPHLGIVGYAARFAAGGNETSPAWHWLGMAYDGVTEFPVTWRLGPVGTGGGAPGSPAAPAGSAPAASSGPANPGGAPAPGSAAVPVVAVACFGGGGPTKTFDARLLPLPQAAGNTPGQPADSAAPADQSATPATPATPATQPAAPAAQPAAPAQLSPAEQSVAESAACSYPQHVG
jgi:hypothetical protein